MIRIVLRPRRGVALLAAIWLIVGIAVVVLQFSLVARERNLLGLTAADRGRERAAALGGLASLQARMEYDLRIGPTGAAAQSATRAADPWFAVDSTYSGTTYVDSIPVEVVARDLGTMVNINTVAETELRTMLGFVFGDVATADRLAAAIIDWRDADDNARPNGAERDAYLKDGLLVLPTNGQFREVDDLINVYGMTPELLEVMRPYVTTRGTTQYRINLNSAPEPVLRALPGMTDEILNQILSLRSAGRRITSVQQVMNASNRGGRGGQPNPRQQATTAQLEHRAGVNTTDVELSFYVYTIGRPQPTRLIAILNRGGNNQANVSWQLW
jgi:general secretion pathway protein K